MRRTRCSSARRWTACWTRSPSVPALAPRRLGVQLGFRHRACLSPRTAGGGQQRDALEKLRPRAIAWPWPRNLHWRGWRFSLDVTGLAPLFGEHVYVTSMVPRPKPAPDVYSTGRPSARGGARGTAWSSRIRRPARRPRSPPACAHRLRAWPHPRDDDRARPPGHPLDARADLCHRDPENRPAS